MLFVLLTSPAWLILRLFIDRPVECAGLARYLSAAEVPNIPTCSHTSNSSSVFLMLLMLFMFVLREGITYVIPWVILRDCSSPHHLLCHTHGPGKDHVVFFVLPAIPFRISLSASHTCIA